MLIFASSDAQFMTCVTRTHSPKSCMRASATASSNPASQARGVRPAAWAIRAHSWQQSRPVVVVKLHPQ